MVRGAVTSNPRDPFSEPQLNVEADQVHLVVSFVELDIIVDALRSVGNVDIAERFEDIMQRVHQSTRGDRT
jgi:hypothetical protein